MARIVEMIGAYDGDDLVPPGRTPVVPAWKGRRIRGLGDAGQPVRRHFLEQVHALTFCMRGHGQQAKRERQGGRQAKDRETGHRRAFVCGIQARVWWQRVRKRQIKKALQTGVDYGRGFA